jgi:hypothetical protein
MILRKPTNIVGVKEGLSINEGQPVANIGNEA